MTAEGQVDSVISRIQNAPVAAGTGLPSPSGTGLPCGTSTVTGVSVGSDKMSITTTVTYSTTADAAVDCSALATTPVAKAKIKSTTTSSRVGSEAPAVRTVETLLNLKPTYANGLNKAIFSNGTDDISFQSNPTIYGSASGLTDADIYTNGNVNCNNGTFYGSIYTQKSATFAGACIVYGNLHTKLGYTSNNGAALVKGDVLASGGSIALGSSQVPGHAYASGTAAGNLCTAAKCFGSQTVAVPPTQAFPQYIWNASTKQAWIAAGYTPVELSPSTGYACNWYNASPDPLNLNGKVDNVGAWLVNNAKSTTKYVVHTTCAVKFQGPNLVLGADLAVFADGGFTVSSGTHFKSNTAVHHNLYLIQPYNSVSSPCTSDGIALDNTVQVESTVTDLLYTPCNIRQANTATQFGQVYAGGKVQIDNALQMTYQPLPVFGLSVAGGSVDKYTVDILYMRETTP